MTDERICDTARAAAELLSAELGPGLETEVEAALQAGSPAQPPEQYVDPISLGGLLVSVATLAWSVYTDLKAETPSPAPDVVARTVRVKLGTPATTTPEEQDRIIDIVVTETVQAANTSS